MQKLAINAKVHIIVNIANFGVGGWGKKLLLDRLLKMILKANYMLLSVITVSNATL